MKETTDILRDRRTLISMILVPILFYPVFSMGIGSVISSQVEKSFSLDQPVLVMPSAIEDSLLASLSRRESIMVVPSDSVRYRFQRAALSGAPFDESDVTRLFSHTPRGIPDSTRTMMYAYALEQKWVRAVLETTDEVAGEGILGFPKSLRLYTDEEDVNSMAAGEHIASWLEHVRDSVVLLTLSDRGIDHGVLSPFDWSIVNLATAQKRSGRFMALFLPYFLIILTMTGGMYPALDITAGEKERQTLETLLMAPVRRSEIAIGKFLTVFLAGMVSMALATASMVISSNLGGASLYRDDSALPFALTFEIVMWIVVLMVPTAMLFSSVLITVSVCARSFREGQSYVTPLLLAIILPAMISFIPGIELTWPTTVIPVVNLCLAMKAVLLGNHNAPMILAVVATSTLYAAFMLYVTTRIFERESVLFRS